MRVHEPRRDHDQGFRMRPRGSLERGVEVVIAPDLQGLALYTEHSRGQLGLAKVGIRVIRIPEDAHSGNPGCHLLEQLQSLPCQLIMDECHPRDVATRAGEIRHESRLNRIVAGPHDDWDRSGRLLAARIPSPSATMTSGLRRTN